MQRPWPTPTRHAPQCSSGLDRGYQVLSTLRALKVRVALRGGWVPAPAASAGPAPAASAAGPTRVQCDHPWLLFTHDALCVHLPICSSTPPAIRPGPVGRRLRLAARAPGAAAAPPHAPAPPLRRLCRWWVVHGGARNGRLCSRPCLCTCCRSCQASTTFQPPRLPCPPLQAAGSPPLPASWPPRSRRWSCQGARSGAAPLEQRDRRIPRAGLLPSANTPQSQPCRALAPEPACPLLPLPSPFFPQRRARGAGSADGADPPVPGAELHPGAARRPGAPAPPGVPQVRARGGGALGGLAWLGVQAGLRPALTN